MLVQREIRPSALNRGKSALSVVADKLVTRLTCPSRSKVRSKSRR